MIDLDNSKSMLESIENSGFDDLRSDLYEAAFRYVGKRIEWHMTDLDSRSQLDKSRSVSHDAFIDCCNILSRNMAKVGEDNSWREMLGSDRKVIGDFACYLVCLLGIKAR